MTNKQIDNRVNKLNSIKAQIVELQSKADAIEAELKTDMESKGLETVDTGNFIVRWTKVISNRLDSKAFKTAMPDIYGKFIKQTESRRFSIA